MREVQLLLALWTGACPTCHRDIPDPAPTWPSPTSSSVGTTRSGGDGESAWCPGNEGGLVAEV
ncbi:hypothetical protein DF268_07740 [Streptomyces sp. V2]|nr:hypothetical protein DF268_07740 [Streptomyces sp. V2]